MNPPRAEPPSLESNTPTIDYQNHHFCRFLLLSFIEFIGNLQKMVLVVEAMVLASDQEPVLVKALEAQNLRKFAQEPTKYLGEDASSGASP